MKFKLTIFLFYFIFISQNLFALQLGKINVSSKQDEPLSAVIDVIFSKIAYAVSGGHTLSCSPTFKIIGQVILSAKFIPSK